MHSTAYSEGNIQTFWFYPDLTFDLVLQLVEDAKQSLTFTGPVTLSDDGVLELYAEEEGLIAVRLEDLKTRLQELTELQVGHTDS